LVFFDLDGTVSRRDTLWLWVSSFLWRHPWRWPQLLGLLPCLWHFARGRADRGELKGRLLQLAVGGCERRALAQHTEHWIAAFLPKGCHVDALASIRAHQAQQDRLILMSASVDIYVPALAKALGFDECICTPTAWRADGAYDGRLTGPNCRGEEKARRLRSRRAQSPESKTCAYGNSAPDLPHLRLADRGVLVNAPRRLRDAAAAAGIECLDWR
jgi:phosphatidylglycerophosphatase C